AEKEGVVAVIKIFRKRRWTHIEFKLAVRSRQIAAQNISGVRIQRVGVKGHPTTATGGDTPASKIQKQLKNRMEIETLHNRRSDDRIATNVDRKLDRVLNCFLATDSVGRTFKRKIEWEFFEKA